MESGTDSQDENSKPSESRSTKKKKSFGRMTEVMKKLRATSFESGENCNCKILKCFEKISYQQSVKLLYNFNELGEWNKQSAYLAGLITIVNIQRRYAKDMSNAVLRDCSFKYRVRVDINGEFKDIEVCREAFKSVHGVTKARLETIQRSLKRTGKAPIDNRGKHNTRPNKISDEVKKAMYDHINSFKGRACHYSLKKSDKIYLPEELSIKKMFEMFCQENPNKPYEKMYELYRIIFNTKFNISFGYPRKDTCSTCDQHSAEVKTLNLKLSAEGLSLADKNEILTKINEKQTEQRLHLLRANTFYDRKRTARKLSRKSIDTEAICLDYQRNLHIPNITTNDVYYKRQLSYYTLNIHQLSNSKSVWFCYSEDIANKGCNEVVSFLNYFIENQLDPRVRNLYMFCDSCAGQNKNYTVLRYCHYVVHHLKRLDSLTVTFPMRGHSFMECDKSMGLINTKTRVELPREWAEVIRSARSKPEPFTVVEVEQDMVRDWTTFFKDELNYVDKAPLRTRPIKEIKVEKAHMRLLQYRNFFNGAWSSVAITKPGAVNIHISRTEFLFPSRSYEDPIQISHEKFNDLQALKVFCGEEAKDFFDKLKSGKIKKQKKTV